MSNEAFGIEAGETCNRNGCQGVIDEVEPDGCCSCHINPPCAYCTTPKEYCPECDWSAEEEAVEAERFSRPSPEEEARLRRNFQLREIRCMPRRFDPNDVNVRVRGHTHFSQIVEGWFPKGWTPSQVRERVDGTFGGRFDAWSDQNQTFRFIAYTD